MSELDDRFDSLVRDTVAPLLKSRGYAKRKLSWVRRTEAAVHWITLQRSQGNAPDHLRFYVELAAYVPAFARTVGAVVPDDPTKATPPYRRRFEQVVQWPGQWVDLEDWDDASLAEALQHALGKVDEHLVALDGPEALVAAMRSAGSGLDLELFAWWCATGDTAGMADQLALAEAGFGQEERWPRLFAQFERVAARFGVALPAIAR